MLGKHNTIKNWYRMDYGTGKQGTYSYYIIDLREWDTNNIVIKFCSVINNNNNIYQFSYLILILIFTTVHNMMYTV